MNSTVQDVSQSEQIGYDAILGALTRQVDTEIDWDQVTDLNTIGIDEISTRKGHNAYAAIISARQTDGTVRVLAVLPERKNDSKGIS